MGKIIDSQSKNCKNQKYELKVCETNGAENEEVALTILEVEYES